MPNRFLAGALMVLGLPAAAQVAEMPDVARAIRDMGPALSREMVGGTMALYKDLLPGLPVEGVDVLADQRYGEAERNVLDVYRPAETDGSEPVLIFAHGGGFVRGDKADVANLGAYFAGAGVVFVAMNYRFAPDAMWPSGAEDMAAAVAWVRAQADLHGGDPARIVVAGNSAGSAHAADFLFGQADKAGVIGAILISPPTANLTDHEIDPARDALYYGTEGLEERSYLSRVGQSTLPVMVALGELDLPLVHDQAGQLIAALLKRDGRLPVTSIAPGHSHISIIQHIGSPDASLGPDMLEFLRYVALFPEG